MNPTYLSPLANHLWQSTLFVAIAGMLTLLIRKNRARARYWVWLAASWKFLVPFSVLISVGSHMHWRTAPQAMQSNLSVVMDEVSQPFTAPAASSVPMTTAAPPAAGTVPVFLWTIWACGFLGINCSWWVRWRRIRAAVRAGTPVHLELPIRAVSSRTPLEPGVFGVFRPVLLLPEGILDRLTTSQLEGVVAHELCHVYHRDNLFAAVHMFVETVFWFHPLVWWIGKRMLEERELACDEEVLRLGNEPRVYAEGILTICRLSVESRLPCVAGVTGPSLKSRIRTILSGWPIQQISPARKAVLAFAGVAAVVWPLVIGMLHAPRLGAQSPTTPIPKFEVVSVKPCPVGGRGRGRGDASPGRLTTGCWPLADANDHTGLIQQAYNRYAGGQFNPMRILAIEGGPAWIHSESFSIDAKAEGQPSLRMMNGPMMQAVLEDRFHLKIHRETREGEVYALTLPRGAAKLKSFQPGSCVATSAAPPRPPLQPGQQYCRLVISTQSFDAQGISLTDAAGLLSLILDRPVIDRTGMAGSFEIHLEFSPDPGRPRMAYFASPMDLTAPKPPTPDDPTGPTVFQAVEQLGLRLTPAKGPIEFLVIDHVERPSEN